uniref:Uncharacterized protein n=1 Tax=Acrobeloides nanus TaxID=290746 RepID=A0A914C2G8_9BILA
MCWWCPKIKCCRICHPRLWLNLVLTLAVIVIFTAIGFQLERSIPCWKAQFNRSNYLVGGGNKKVIAKTIQDQQEKEEENLERLCKNARNFIPILHYMTTPAFFIIIAALLGHVLVSLKQRPKDPDREEIGKKPVARHCSVYVGYPCHKCGQVCTELRHLPSTASATYESNAGDLNHMGQVHPEERFKHAIGDHNETEML